MQRNELEKVKIHQQKWSNLKNREIEDGKTMKSLGVLWTTSKVLCMSFDFQKKR